MEKEINLQWLENAKLNFDEAVEKGDYQQCLAVISDVRTNGFGDEAKTLRSLLHLVPLEKFTHQSYIQRYDL